MDKGEGLCKPRGEHKHGWGAAAGLFGSYLELVSSYSGKFGVVEIDQTNKLGPPVRGLTCLLKTWDISL